MDKYGIETRSGRTIGVIRASSPARARKIISRKYKVIRSIKYKNRTIVGYVVEA